MFGTGEKRVVITVEDKGNDVIGVSMNPKMEHLLKKIDSGATLTAAEEVVFFVLNGLRKRMKGGEQKTPSGLILPKKGLDI